MRFLDSGRLCALALGLGSIFFLLLAWEGLSRAELISPFLLPPPTEIFSAFHELASRGFPDGILITSHILVTLRRIFLGFLTAASLALPLGLLIGYSPRLDRLSHPVITFGRSMAALSVLPLFIAWLGIGELSKVMLIAFGAFWVMLTYTVSSVKLMDPTLIRAARSMDVKGWDIFRHVMLPACLPRIFIGLKVALVASFTIIVAAEMIATVRGLGALIMEARNSFRTDITMAGMLLIGALGFGASKLLDACEDRLLPWHRGLKDTP